MGISESECRRDQTETSKNREKMAGKAEKTEAELRAALGIKIELMAKDIGTLAKDGRNDFTKYDYISNDQLTASLRQKLGDHLLSITSDVIDYEERESVDAKGKQVIRSIVKMAFEITDLETGHREIRQFVGAEQDTGGKSFQQAVTQCSKYFYFKLFKVTSRDESDPDSKSQSASKAQKSAPAKQQENDDRLWLNPNDADGRWDKIVSWIAAGNEFKGVYQKYKLSKANAEKLKNDADELKKKLNQ